MNRNKGVYLLPLAWLLASLAVKEWRVSLSTWKIILTAVYSTGEPCFFLPLGMHSIIVCWDGTFSSWTSRLSKQIVWKWRPISLRESILHLWIFIENLLSSPRSLWDSQQPKLLSGTAILEPCAACFVDNLQAFPRMTDLCARGFPDR